MSQRGRNQGWRTIGVEACVSVVGMGVERAWNGMECPGIAHRGRRDRAHGGACVRECRPREGMNVTST